MLFLITNPYNIYYLTGYLADNLRERQSFVLTDFESELIHIVPAMFSLSVERSRRDTLGLKLKVKELAAGSKLTEVLAAECARLGETEVYFEREDLGYAEHSRLQAALRKQKIKFKADDSPVDELREIKTAAEIDAIKKATEVAVSGLKAFRKSLILGISEEAAAESLINCCLAAGAEAMAFPPIVAFGENSALPHHHPGDRKLKHGDIVLIDWGVRLQGYNSDLTRTICFGNADAVFASRYALVRKALDSAVAAIKPSTKISAVTDLAIRELGEEKAKFNHALGHGVGVEVHEYPSVSQYSSDEFLAGQVLAIEPGIYYPGWGGIRLEKMVCVTNTGVEVLDNLDVDDMKF